MDTSTVLSDIFGDDPHPFAWKLKAVCTNVPIDVFFEAVSEDTALEFCSQCPVRKECLDYAMNEEGSSGERYGVYGGLTPTERNKEYRRRHPKERIRWHNG